MLPDDTREDEKYIARVEASNRVMWRLVWTLSGGLALVVATVAAVVLSGHADWQQSGWFQMAVAAVVGALFLYVLVMMGRHHVPPMEANPRLARRRIDAQQRRWRWALTGNIFTTLVFTLSMTGNIKDIAAQHGLVSLVTALGACAFPLLMAVMLAIGPRWQSFGQPGMASLLDDEFTVALRARTLRFGYIFLMVAISAVMLIALRRPDLTLAALSWALFAGFAAPTLYYVVADWRAGRES